MKRRSWALPYLFTVANLFCGLLAIVYGLNTQFVAASWLIIVAGLLDGLDGKIARFTGSSTRFGVEFDSMADLISFGLAPAVVLYKFEFHLMESWGWVFIFIYVAAGSFRLARFNYQFKGVREDFFRGMPITMAGMTVAALIIFFGDLKGGSENTVVAIMTTLLLSAVMISTIRYEGLPRFSLETRKDKTKAVIIFFSALATALKPSCVLFPLMMGYLFLGPIQWAINAASTKSTIADNTNVSKPT